MACPYVEQQNPMEMVGHDYEFIQRYVDKMAGNFLPASLNDGPDQRRFPLSVYNFAEPAFHPVTA